MIERNAKAITHEYPKLKPQIGEPDIAFNEKNSFFWKEINLIFSTFIEQRNVLGFNHLPEKVQTQLRMFQDELLANIKGVERLYVKFKEAENIKDSDIKILIQMLIYVIEKINREKITNYRIILDKHFPDQMKSQTDLVIELLKLLATPNLSLLYRPVTLEAFLFDDTISAVELSSFMFDIDNPVLSGLHPQINDTFSPYLIQISQRVSILQTLLPQFSETPLDYSQIQDLINTIKLKLDLFKFDQEINKVNGIISKRGAQVAEALLKQDDEGNLVRENAEKAPKWMSIPLVLAELRFSNERTHIEYYRKIMSILESDSQDTNADKNPTELEILRDIASYIYLVASDNFYSGILTDQILLDLTTSLDSLTNDQEINDFDQDALVTDIITHSKYVANHSRNKIWKFDGSVLVQHYSWYEKPQQITINLTDKGHIKVIFKFNNQETPIIIILHIKDQRKLGYDWNILDNPMSSTITKYFYQYLLIIVADLFKRASAQVLGELQAKPKGQVITQPTLPRKIDSTVRIGSYTISKPLPAHRSTSTKLPPATDSEKVDYIKAELVFDEVSFQTACKRGRVSDESDKRKLRHLLAKFIQTPQLFKITKVYGGKKLGATHKIRLGDYRALLNVAETKLGKVVYSIHKIGYRSSVYEDD